MIQIKLSGEIHDFEKGLSVLLPELDCVLSQDGFPVEVQHGTHLKVTRQKDGAFIMYHRPVEFFRAFGMLIEHFSEENVLIEETASFDTNGIMFDCSRNAVLTVETLKYFFRKMALMGLNLGMMYTEDTYSIPTRPYFGYLRGRYTLDELRELDDYADSLGIELVPCIQTLSHLDRPLHWPAAEPLRDTEVTLLVGSDETYQFIEEMILAASKPYRTKRIHIGMDEAWDLGIGKYREKNGYHERFEIMAEHLKRVNDILKKHDMIPMMWSDMHFYNASDVYLNPNCQFTQEIIDSAPENISLVYWDYFSDQEDFYDGMLKLHELFAAETIFAGGIWTWTGAAIDYRKTLAATIPALSQCKKHGVKQVFATAWGDNGAESNLLTILYGLQLFAEIDYQGYYDESHTKKRFAFCVGADPNAFLDISLFNEIPGLRRVGQNVVNPHKPLLFEDPLMPLFEKDFEGLDILSHYRKLEEKFSVYQTENPDFALLFEFYTALARALVVKENWRSKAATAVRSKDYETAKSLPDLAEENINCLYQLKEAWRSLWFSTNKPFGFEVIDVRLGGIISRFESAKQRMQDFADRKIEDIPELSCEKLPYLKTEDGEIRYLSQWSKMITACNI
jgi:hexosaminidase